jgi:putative NADH-flavin reductase
VLLKRKQYEVRRYSQLPPTATGSSSSSSRDGDDAIFAAAGFIGAAEDAAKVEAALRSALQKDGLQPEAGRRLLVPGGKGSLLAKRRSEVLIPLTAFQLW